MSGVLEALAHVVPIAIAVAASSVPILVTLTILLSPHAERLSGPFLAGWLVGMTALVIGCTMLAEALPREGSGRKPNEAVGIAEIVVGVLIIAVAAIGRLRKPSVVGSDEPPKWLASMNRLGPWEGFALGAVLNLRPKSLLLIVAAALSVRGAELSTGQTAIVLVIFIVLGASTVAVPIIAAKVSPARTAPKLTAMREWMARHSRTVTGLILLVIGVFVIVTGIGRL